MTRTSWWATGAAGGLALALACALPAPRTSAAQAQAPALDQHSSIQGVWEPLGGAILDPLARGMPGNKGRAMPELTAKLSVHRFLFGEGSSATDTITKNLSFSPIIE